MSRCTAFKSTTVDGGIYTDDGCVLSDCVARDNTGGFGIRAGLGSTLTNCSAQNNTVGIGIAANDGSTLSHCSAKGNTGSAASSQGISVGPGSTVTHCTSATNFSSAGSFTASTGVGFLLDAGCTIQNCNAYGNLGDGIRVTIGCVVRENNSRFSGSGGDGAGIHVLQDDNRIEGNNVSANDRGIDVDGTGGNLIIRNSAGGNGTNYELSANNVFGVIVNRIAPGSAAVSGNNAASSAGTTDSWANFSY
jgi:parallel beta-helix repeat protein